MTETEGAAGAPAGTYDAVYVSPSREDALFSCVGRMLAERSEGLRVLVAVVFSGAAPVENRELDRTLDQMGIARTSLGQRNAPERNGYYRDYSVATFSRHLEDEQFLGALTESLSELLLKTRARRVYLPLGAGLHVDHRLCHEAGLRALHEVRGRDVYLYEERPAALLPGAVRIRLADLGARLPPAASEIHDSPSLVRVLADFWRAPHVRNSVSSVSEWLRCLWRLAARWRAAREWHPLRAYGLRLQPKVEGLDEARAYAGLVLLSSCEESVRALFGSQQRLSACLRQYARRQGSFNYLERYWLLLPERDEGGLARLPLADTVAVS